MNIKEILKNGMILLVIGFILNLTGIASASDETLDLLDDIEEYNGSVGPDSALYGLKLAFENLDESFTWNASEKLEKKVSHSRLRISEAKGELRRNNDEAAQKAFERYREKSKETEDSIRDISGEDSGILHAQKMIEKHQYVLEQLLESHSNNTGLRNAYNRSLELKDRFEQKTERKIERVRTKEGKQILREIKKENGDMSNELKIKAKISGNDSRIKIELKFYTNSTNKETIARDILNELRLTRDNISSMLRIENETEDSLVEEMEADAKIQNNATKVDFEYRFKLNETNRTEIIDGIYEKLSDLTQVNIRNVLEIKEKQEVEKDNKGKRDNFRKEDENRKENIQEIRENKTEDRDDKRGGNKEDRK